MLRKITKNYLIFVDLLFKKYKACLDVDLRSFWWVMGDFRSYIV